MPEYRYSEDLDFDWLGSPTSYHNTLDAALEMAARTSGAELILHPGKGPNPTVRWQDKGHQDAMKTEAAFLTAHQLPTRTWTIQPNHPDIPPSPPILGYQLVSVMADKLICISRRIAPRDFYDLNSLLAARVDIHAAWSLYVEHHRNPEREYGRRPHPSDIRASYLGRRDLLAHDWNNLVQRRRLPAIPFHRVLANVDTAIDTALNQWKQQLAPGELHRLKQEHQQQPRQGRTLDIGF